MSNAEPFDTMHERINKNADSPFGGACVIVPPQGGGDVISYLSLDQGQDPVLFWSTVRSQVELTLEKLTKNNAVAQTFGRR
jgi:hypothetical protein